jgi:hypothetical protein
MLQNPEGKPGLLYHIPDNRPGGLLKRSIPASCFIISTDLYFIIKKALN